MTGKANAPHRNFVDLVEERVAQKHVGLTQREKRSAAKKRDAVGISSSLVEVVKRTNDGFSGPRQVAQQRENLVGDSYVEMAGWFVEKKNGRLLS